MPCLVAKHVHAGQDSDAAEAKGGAEQNAFGDAPPVTDRTAFVNSHDGKAEEIDQDQI